MRSGELRRDDGAKRHIALLSEPVMHDGAIAPDQMLVGVPCMPYRLIVTGISDPSIA
jgi:hypothetical protein